MAYFMSLKSNAGTSRDWHCSNNHVTVSAHRCDGATTPRRSEVIKSAQLTFSMSAHWRVDTCPFI